jgi:hypothetical protein
MKGRCIDMEELIFGDILKYMLIFGVVELILAFLNWIIFRKNKPIYLRHTFFIGGASFGFILTLFVIFRIFDSYGLVYYR